MGSEQKHLHLVLEGQRLDGGGALVRVEVPLGLLREPALVVLGVLLEHVAPVARELRAVPSGVQPREDLVRVRVRVRVRVEVRVRVG